VFSYESGTSDHYDVTLLKTKMMVYTKIKLESGLALGIGQGWDGLGPLPVGGPKFFVRKGVYIQIFGFWGVCLAKFTDMPKHVERLCWSLLIFMALLSQFAIHTPLYTKISIHTLLIKFLVFLNNVPKQLLSNKFVIFFWALCF